LDDATHLGGGFGLRSFAGRVILTSLNRERRAARCRHFYFSGTIASVARSTPCKCVCRADQTFFSKRLSGLPFVAVRRAFFEFAPAFNQSPRFDTDVRCWLRATGVVMAGKTRERS
jgi:hypothetical protein